MITSCLWWTWRALLPLPPGCRPGALLIELQAHLVDRSGIEPEFLPCERSVLPLYEQPTTTKMGCLTGVDPVPLAPQASVQCRYTIDTIKLATGSVAEKLERVGGVAPPSRPWQGRIILLYDTRKAG